MQRLATANLRALPGAVDVAVITVPADTYLHAEAAAAVEPIGRRLSGAEHPCLPEALDSARWQAHKRLAKTPAKALRTEGPWVDTNQRPGLRLFILLRRAAYRTTRTLAASQRC